MRSQKVHEGRRSNPPNRSSINYSLDVHSGFMQRMLDKLHLAGPDFGGETSHPLRRLNIGSTGDPAIAIIDAWATVADILSFYQERIANEGFLRTATERRSVLELVRLIGYELAPGAAAETYLAFTVENSPGSEGSVDIPASSKVQGIPDPGKLPQIFETSQELQARFEWNSLIPMITGPQALGDGSTQMLLKGIYTHLKPGDVILLVGSAREADSRSDAWQIRTLTEVCSSTERDATLVAWKEPIERLGDPKGEAFRNPSAFVLRSHASLFGSGASDWKLLPFEMKEAYVKATLGPGERLSDYEWPGFEVKRIEGSWVIDLDSVYDDIRKDSWVILTAPPPFGDEYSGMIGLFRARETAVAFRSEFAAAAKISRIFPDTHNNLENFPIRETRVFFNSEPLCLAEVPLQRYIDGDTVDLSHKVRGLMPGRILAFSGIALTQTGEGKGDGAEGRSTLGSWLQGGDESDPGAINKENASEIAVVRAVEDMGDRTRLTLEAPLKNRYDSASLTICANVVRATHGETVSETLGSGDRTLANQSFVLKKPPLTHIRSGASDGVASTLDIRVNGISWNESPSLLGLDKSSLSYILRLGDDGRPTVTFGDGRSGARLPTGDGNVTATYRSGIGPDGNLPQGRLILLHSRPPEIRDVTNPVRALGGEPPEALSLATHNAPTTVQILGRVVSLRDYENFSRIFPGVGKAYAATVCLGYRPIIHITIAASDGSVVDDSSPVRLKLIEAIDAIRNPIEGVMVNSFILKTFSVKARVRVGFGYDFSEVRKNIIATLRSRFSFEMRQFGESVYKSEVIAEIQRTEGVEVVDIDWFDFGPIDDQPEDKPMLTSSLTRVENGSIFPAELLLINPSESGIILSDINSDFT